MAVKRHDRQEVVAIGNAALLRYPAPVHDIT